MATTRRRRSGGLAAVLVVVSGLAGCADPTRGSAVPAGDLSGRAGAVSSTRVVAAGLDSVRPCALLSGAAVRELGAGPGREERVGKRRSCQWVVDRPNMTESHAIAVELFPELGIKDIVAQGEVTTTRVGGHDAAESIRRGEAGCVVSLAVTTTSRVDVAVAGGDPVALCPVARRAAVLVEPGLP
ncbi:DUF3558 family protein [Actinokineospora sp. NBRC 105648]|uniref:DUF3558 family protein n=1 Tax=Actinokineospora sp. NBRC 105648 TaxID=3032206 RepID=UPI002553F692|nr:DUF3558 family protein [Actinokineospora sp. NBRC 105648]